jgi:hypothetical protein
MSFELAEAVSEYLRSQELPVDPLSLPNNSNLWDQN